MIAEIPEIGPYLGRLADAVREFEDPAVGLDAVRFQLVSDLFERVQSARGFLLVDDEEGARAALDRAAWLELWRRAARRAAGQTSDAIAGRLADAGRRSRYPGRRLARLVPLSEAREILASKLEAAGIPLESLVARGFPAGAGWWDGVRQAAVALEDSWEELEAVIKTELAVARAVAERVETWRPSPLPWYAALGAAVAITGWLGLVLGGYLPRPQWLDPFNDWFWSLPWP